MQRQREAQATTNVANGERQRGALRSPEAAVPESESDGLPARVYDLLPRTFRRVLHHMKPGPTRDVVLLGSLGVLSGCTPNVCGSTATRVYGTPLYVAVVAPAAAGKGVLSFARRLGAVVDDQLVSDRSVHRSEDGPLRPPGLFLPANASAAAFFDALESGRGRGVIFDTEIDTLSSALGQEWGNFSDVLRKAFEHETATVLRKETHLVIPTPEVAVVLAGTPGQVGHLFRSAENGLVSRVLFYTFDASEGWRSQRPTRRTREREEAFDMFAEHVGAMHAQLARREDPILFEMSIAQWDRHDETFAAAHDHVVHEGVGDELVASVRRAGVIAFRIAMLLTVLRASTCTDINLDDIDVIEATDADAEAGRIIASACLRHAARIASLLPRSAPSRSSSRGRVFEKFARSLPERFTRAEADSVGENLAASRSTVTRYIRELEREGQVFRERRGVYRRVE